LFLRLAIVNPIALTARPVDWPLAHVCSILFAERFCKISLLYLGKLISWYKSNQSMVTPFWLRIFGKI
ncbi:MAG TPA: hypothetical protein VJT54_04560, partial [Verrucomicrobiae bacterium]|nr:hypothetical protein [Verrucomicrobiae bacterium]